MGQEALVLRLSYSYLRLAASIGLSSNSHEGNCELNDNKADSEDDNGESRPMKRKRPSSSYDGLMHKKRKHHPRQRFLANVGHTLGLMGSARSRTPLLVRVRESPRVSNPEGRLPLPAPSALQTMDTEMPSGCYNLDRSSCGILPTLIEVTFRLHYPQCYSFTAVIRDSCDGRGVSFSRLVKSIGHVGKIDDFTIKPIVRPRRAAPTGIKERG
jgi:hypothetical protein